MIVEPMEVKDKLGRTVVLRSAKPSDGESLIRYVKETAAETPFLIREPDEFSLTLKEEEEFIEGREKDPKALMLLALVNGKLAGNCALMSVGNYRRYAHRCEVAIALYQDYCKAGIGRIMLETVLEKAREAGYEQAELEVAKENVGAVKLYQSLGFQIYGTFPDNMKYSDGTYGDTLWMMKKL